MINCITFAVLLMLLYSSLPHQIWYASHLTHLLHNPTEHVLSVLHIFKIQLLTICKKVVTPRQRVFHRIRVLVLFPFGGTFHTNLQYRHTSVNYNSLANSPDQTVPFVTLKDFVRVCRPQRNNAAEFEIYQQLHATVELVNTWSYRHIHTEYSTHQYSNKTYDLWCRLTS